MVILDFITVSESESVLKKQLINHMEEHLDQYQAVYSTTLFNGVKEAMSRIINQYDLTQGSIYLSFSGGKDSTVLAHLIMMLDLPTKIPFVFANTGIEMDATLRFVKNFPYENIVIVKPTKPFGKILKDYGKPALSKLKSDMISTYQKHLDEPFKTSRARQLISGQRERNFEVVEGRVSQKLANKHFHFLHPDTEFKVANKCCFYMKKEPFRLFEMEIEAKGSFNGVRRAEGGTRALMYQTCVQVKQKKGKPFHFSMPIIDWSDEMVEEFIKAHNISLSDAYEKYGMKRTGCIGCPYGKNLEHELKILHDFEPQRYKATMHWLKDVYMYQLIECPWDEAYMKEFNELQPVIEERRTQMLNELKGEKGRDLLEIYRDKSQDKFNKE